MVYYSINSYFIVHSSGVRSLSRGRSRAVYCVDSTLRFTGTLTRILSKAEGVPPLCTCPRTVVRVSKPSLSVTNWTQTNPALCSVYCQHSLQSYSHNSKNHTAYLFDLVRCNRFAILAHGALGHNDHI